MESDNEGYNAGIKCNTNDVTHAKANYKPWIPSIIWILIGKIHIFQWKTASCKRKCMS
jgi:hypothetical protein